MAAPTDARRIRRFMAVLSLALLLAGAWSLRGLLLPGGLPRRATAADQRPRVGSLDRTRPNVVLFVIDTLRADRLGAYGYERFATSPNIDALAAQGVLFEQAYACAPWTLPSVSSLMTGRLPCDHGMLDTNARLNESTATLVTKLRDAGYATLGLYGNFMVGPDFGFDRGYVLYQGSLRNEDAQVDAMLDSAPAGPLFLYVHNIEPHNPYLYAPPHTAGFPDVCSATRAKIAQHYKAYRAARRVDFFAGRPPGATNTTAEQERHLAALNGLRREYSDLYDASVRLADARFGRVLAALKRRGLWDNTLLVLVSDHGEEMGEHGGWMHDQSLYEELIHVPLILRLPYDANAGRRVPEIVSLADVGPTIGEYLQLAIGAGGIGTGRLALANGQASPNSPKSVLDTLQFVAMRIERMNYFHPVKMTRGDVNVAIRCGAWKGIWNAEWDSFELYNVALDPLERQDVQSEHREMVEAMRARARQILEGCAEGTGPQRGEARRLNADTLDNLRALGYVD